jgi:hypothetical protein
MQNLRLLVCRNCLDEPQSQLRAIVVPPDPMPIQNPRVPDYVTAETNTRYTSGQNTIDPNTGIPVPGGNVRITQDGNDRVTQQTGEPPGGLNQEPGTDPNIPTGWTAWYNQSGNILLWTNSSGVNVQWVNNVANPGLPYNNNLVPETGPLDE